MTRVSTAGAITKIDAGEARPSRRALMSFAAVWLTARSLPARAGGQSASAEDIEIEEFDAAGRSQGVKRLARITRSDAEWRARLSPQAFAVTRQDGTERAFSGAYWNAHDDGLYRCICCETALFDSAAKYESGTGWPSFWRAIARANVAESDDRSFGTKRVAVSCRLCGAHLGHVFDDGPQPTGLRYCMNSAALRFVARAREAN